MSKTGIINPPQIMGKSPRIVRIFEQVKKAASQEMPVLISGESGTYKELVARIIHDNSPRNKGPFVAMNLASIPSDLLENAVIGYPPLTAAEGCGQQSGKIFEANGGTLFIEEISRADAILRDKLTLLVRDRAIPLNDHDVVRSDVRIICTSSGNIGGPLKKGHPLYDLFKGSRSVHVRIPPLRERKEDILPLARYFMDESAGKFDTGRRELSRDAEEYLLKYEWPGNLRELENMMRKATILSRGPLLEKRDLLMADIGSCSIKEFLEEKLKRYLQEMMKLESCNVYDTVLSEVERSLIAIVLQETKGNQLKTARTLGINRNTLRSKIKSYKIRV